MILAEAIGEKGFLSLENAEKNVRRRKMHYNGNIPTKYWTITLPESLVRWPQRRVQR